jgi:HK97 family phage major capsid protein
MTQVEIEALKAQLATLIEEKTKGTASAEALKALEDKLVEAQKGAEATSELKTEIAKMQGELSALKEAPKGGKVVKFNLGSAVVKQIAENLEAAKGRTGFAFEVKAEGDLTEATGWDGVIALSELDTEVDRIPRQRVLLRNLINSRPAANKNIVYIQQTVQAVAGMTAEAAAKFQTELAWEEVSVPMKKVTAFIKVSMEMLDDLVFIAGEINSELVMAIEDKVEDGILNGTGLGENLKGMLEFAVNFDANGFVTTFANLTDVIAVAAAQVENAKLRATHVILNPTDVLALRLTKTSTGEYTYPVFITDSVTGLPVVVNLQVVSTTWMEQGTFLVGDLSQSNLRVRKGISISVGRDGDDFTRNMVTILAETRCVHYIKANKAAGFVTGNIAAAIAVLND